MANSGPKVLVLAWDDESDPNSLSGMPWEMRQALERAGCHVVLGPIGNLHSVRSSVRESWRGWRRLRRIRTLGRNTIEKVLPRLGRGKLESLAISAARAADESVRRHAPDVVFGPAMSVPIGRMESKTPIVYASDATATLICQTYETFKSRGQGWKDMAIELETSALARADRTALATVAARRSAIEDHGADPERVRVVPFGANVHRGEGEQVDIPAPVPSRDDLRLLLTAADPERKRLNFCVEIVRELRRRGWMATLHFIGSKHPAVEAPEVEWAGKLRLGDEADQKIHRRLLRECHLGLLPSLAEMFGIAPIESAVYGRPSVVSDAGGLPTVVMDGETGRVVPVEAPASVWADAVLDLVQDPGRYARISTQVERRYEDVLNWDAWGRRVRGLIQEVV